MNRGNYENSKLEVKLEVGEDENAQEVLDKLRTWVKQELQEEVDGPRQKLCDQMQLL